MNALNWFEIPVVDFDRACAFYSAILKTTLTINKEFPGTLMAMLPYKEPGVGGCLLQMKECRPNPDGVRVYLNGGEDLAVILARVEPAGGRIVIPKTLIREDIGHFAYFADTEGNVLGLHSMR